MKASGKNSINATVVDAFCGIGGLSHGMILEGFKVTAGVDNDESCKYAFEKNNHAKFIHKDIAEFSSTELRQIYKGSRVRILTGCAPCQPFSSLSKKKVAHETRQLRSTPLYEFMRLVVDVLPDIVSMENVPDLSNKQKYPIFEEFIRRLTNVGYRIAYKTVDVSRYGVPQKRKRLVLLASLFGDISLIPETHSKKRVLTVRDAIAGLRPIRDGEVDPMDALHRASKLSRMNRRRIRATPKNGGSASSWRRDLLPRCYKRKSGRSFMCTVYGRMRWDDPAPTMTTHCVTLGTGRFGHPTQNRAISLREAATFQSFPKDYEFAEPHKISITTIAQQIGNAVPVLLGRVIAKSIKKHIRLCEIQGRLPRT
jgi:DNA (cytosine-5)-methyltransferase 1